MTVVIAGYISIDPAKREQAIAAVRPLMEATHKEAGCVAYIFSEDLVEPGTFRLFEEWKSQADVDAHTQTPHMATFQKVAPTLGIRGMKLQKYEVSKVGPLR